jgi:hypothetical protein
LGELLNNTAFHAWPVISKPTVLLGLNCDLLSDWTFFTHIQALTEPRFFFLELPKDGKRKKKKFKSE